MERRMKFLFAAQQLNPRNRLQHKQLLGQQWRVQDQLLVAHSCPRHRTVASKHRTGSLEAKQRKSTSFLGWSNCNTRSVSSNSSSLLLDVVLINFFSAGGKKGFHCGGSLVNEFYVLTGESKRIVFTLSTFDNDC